MLGQWVKASRSSPAGLEGRGERGSARRHRGREPGADTIFKVGDVVVVCGTPEAVEHAETLLLMG